MALTFQKATKKQLKARIALLGPAGSGKSYTALRLAFALAGPNGRVAAIDTEHRSLSKYVGEAPDGRPWEFDVLELETFSPENYIEGIRAAEAASYDVLIIDSLSHAWAGKDGLLEFVDLTARKMATRGGRENSFAAWREATPKHNELVEAMLAARLHLIVTMRVKTEYVQEKDPATDKTTIRKVGLQPIQRDGLEYEFDVIGDLDVDNNLLVSKSRCSKLTGRLFAKPGPDMVAIIRDWLESGAPEAPPHWTEIAHQKETFLERVKALGLSGADVLEALGGVDKVGDYTGTLDDALAALQAIAQPREIQARSAEPLGEWTRDVAERQAFKRFLVDHQVSDDEAKRIAGEALGQVGPIGLFSDWPHGRQRLQHVILAWLLANRPHADPATHWMTTDAKAKARFWATMGEHGFDEVKVHEIVPSTKAFPGTCDELIEYILSARPEDRGQLPLLQAEEAF